jgi:hypothetical protein
MPKEKKEKIETEEKKKKAKPMLGLRLRLILTEELLGTANANPDLHGRFVSSKAPDAPSMEEEVATLGSETVERNAMTIFSLNADGQPILWDYQIKGFMKDACSTMRRMLDTTSEEMSSHKKIIDGLIFPMPRQIILQMPVDKTGECQRPLRAQTAQGERVALAHSETVPPGTNFIVDLLLMDGSLKDAVLEWFDYGVLRGLGQWRNSGKGRFVYELLECSEELAKELLAKHRERAKAIALATMKASKASDKASHVVSTK